MREHRTLVKFREKWEGKKVEYLWQTGIVLGVGDDGGGAKAEPQTQKDQS